MAEVNHNPSTELAEYLLDNYGFCKLENKCVCIKPTSAWLGRLCINWVPSGAEDHGHLNSIRRVFEKEG